MLRRCGRCHEEKPVTNFAWRRIKRGQLDNYCRPCRAAYKQEHYQKNRSRYIENARQRATRLVKERTRFILDYLGDHPCADCGEDDPLVLEFDHLRDKKFAISQGLKSRNWDSVLQEIAKCEVVCANCHRRRTARAKGFTRVLVADGDPELPLFRPS